MILEKLLDSDKFTSSEKHLIDFIQDNGNIVVNLSIDDLAAKSNVSQATIIRFCKKVGAKGYTEFKIQLAKELTDFAVGKMNISVDIPIAPNSNPVDIVDTFSALSHHSIENTRNNLDMVKLTNAANLIAYSDVVHIYGRGESLILAEDFHYKLMRIGKHCHLEVLNGFAENLNRKPADRSKMKECALIISQYCNSAQVHYIIDELNLAQIPFILLTAAKNIWPYDKYAKVTLRIDCDESRTKMGCFASRTSFLYVLDCMYGIIFSKNYEENKEHLINCAKQKAEHDYYYSLFPEEEKLI